MPRYPVKPTREKYGKKRRIHTMADTYCGANNRGNGKKCKLPAGFGTTHPGIGRCKWHGGSTPKHIMSAAYEEARVMYGAPMDINPMESILWVIRICAGEVRWLTEKISELTPDEFTEYSVVNGHEVNIWARDRRVAMENLAKYSKWAIELGLAERQVQLAEMYGSALIVMFTKVFDALELNAKQRAAAPGVVRRVLVEIESSRPQSLQEAAIIDHDELVGHVEGR